MAPVHLVGVGVEMLVAQRLQSGEHLVDLGLFADESVARRLLVSARLLRAEFVARGGERVIVVAPWSSCIAVLGSTFARAATLINSISA